MKLCACGCGGEIVVRRIHKYSSVGIPNFIVNHNKRGIKQSEEHKRKRLETRKRNGIIVSQETRMKLSIANKGKKRSEEVKLKFSKLRKGRKLTKEWRENISKALMGNKYGIGYKHTEETKKKMSQGRLREKNGRWLGGKSAEPYGIEFNNILKRKIRKRDGNLCQLCNKTEKENKRKLAVHHIDYNKENSAEENLLTLCDLCNAKVNANRIFWTGFLTGYIISRNRLV